MSRPAKIRLTAKITCLENRSARLEKRLFAGGTESSSFYGLHLHVFVEVHRLVVDVVLHEEVVDAGQEGHLRQGENVHELLHGVTVGALQHRDATLDSCRRRGALAHLQT